MPDKNASIKDND